MTVYAVAVCAINPPPDAEGEYHGRGVLVLEFINATGVVDAMRTHSMFRDKYNNPGVDLNLAKIAKLGEDASAREYLDKVFDDFGFTCKVAPIPVTAINSIDIPAEQIARRGRSGSEMGDPQVQAPMNTPEGANPLEQKPATLVEPPAPLDIPTQTTTLPRPTGFMPFKPPTVPVAPAPTPAPATPPTPPVVPPVDDITGV